MFIKLWRALDSGTMPKLIGDCIMFTIHIELDQLFDVELDSYESELIEFNNEFTIGDEITELDF